MAWNLNEFSNHQEELDKNKIDIRNIFYKAILR